MGRNTTFRSTNKQAKKPRYVGRNFVALDALGVTDGNRRRTRMDNDSRRQGTKYGRLMAALED